MEQFPVTDVDKKVAKILKLIKNKDRSRRDGFSREWKKDSELVRLIDDFYKQYQSLYVLYDNLREESDKRPRARKGKERLSLSASSSDSEYYSSEDIEKNNQFLRRQRETGSDEEKLEASNLEVAEPGHKLASKTEEKEASVADYMTARIEAAEAINKDLRKNLDEKEKELSALAKVQEVYDKQTSGRIAELEAQLISFKTELESLHSQKRDLESQLESNATEAKQLAEKNRALDTQLLELQLESKKKEDDMVNLLKQLKDNENNLTAKTVDLMALVSNLQLEVDCLHAQKCELEGSMVGKRNEVFDQVKGLMDQTDAMQQELESLRNRKTESEFLLEKKTEEISEYLVQMETLKEEIERKTAVEQKMLEEKESLLVRVMDLELEVDSLCKRKNELEDQLSHKIHEANQLREENDGLYARILKLEESLPERGIETSVLEKKGEDEAVEASAQITTLKGTVDNLQQELDYLNSQKNQLELQMEGERQESSQSLFQKEDQNIKLTSKIADQERILKEQGDTINKLAEESKIVKRWSTGSKVNPNILERKMEDLAQEFQKKLEDNIRLLYQRIMVAEKIHFENKENFKKTKERLEKENGLLEEKLAAYDAEFRKLRDILEPANTLSGLDSVARKLENNDDFLTQISDVSNEVAFARIGVTERKNEIERLKKNIDSMVAQLDYKEEQEFLLREKVWNLEAKLSKEGGEKLNLMKAVSQLEKKLGELEKDIQEKDDKLVSLGEEKREAIRQLCVLIDYHRSRCDALKEFISRMIVRNRVKT